MNRHDRDLPRRERRDPPVNSNQNLINPEIRKRKRKIVGPKKKKKKILLRQRKRSVNLRGRRALLPENEKKIKLYLILKTRCNHGG
jgi:hypothetical protein